MTQTAEAIGTTRDIVGESPIWSVAEQALYWVDIEGRHVRRFNLASGQTTTWNTPERVGCIALHRGGSGLVAGMESGIFALELGTAPTLSATLIAGVSHAATNMRFNDSCSDAKGRFWTGTMSMNNPITPVGQLYKLDRGKLLDGSISQMMVQNGLAFSPNGKTIYVSDSHASVQRIWAFDFDMEEGRLSRRREFVDMNQYPGRPDGAAMDIDGCYWICANDAGLIHRFTPDGRLDRSLKIPVSKPSKCAFGGPKLDMLFVTSIIPPQPQEPEKSLAGGVFVLPAGVSGMVDPGVVL